MSTPGDIKAQGAIPQSWANEITCPVCGGSSLMIKRFLSTADQLFCDYCNASFEVSQDRNYLRLVAYPPGTPETLIRGWIPCDHRQIEQPAGGPITSSKSLSHEELVKRALQLRRLGNTSGKTRLALSMLPEVTEEQVDAAMAEVQEILPEKSRLFTFGILVVTLLVVAIIVVVAVGFSRQFANASTEGLPAPVQAWIASGSEVLNLPPVKVTAYRSSGKRTLCPVQKEQAARTFGGDESMWNGTFSGWTFITLHPQSIYIPEGMSGRYPLLVDNPRMVKVQGPVLLENAIYVEVRCGK
ncbi:hypothetical protein ATHL_00953 [Anaerolinea thermolimosa]|uniref:hypothetical protein n=1 Tax=Anaerolinea thermolimosa TaxID=229919 RepID=UPI0013B35CD2|nr:hypothetical protein [Anaerolinea thermolimosa]GAP06107.1 hypothetical protein ATHL_00953 [Anaerolinea thermolimosa]